MGATQLTTFVHNQFSRSNFLFFNFHYSCFSTVILSKPNLRSDARRKASKFLVYCNTQITKYGKNGDIKAAESVFDRMPHKNTISWTAMLTAYAENGKTVKARNMFDQMPERSTASYNAMITAYIRNNCRVEEAFELFSEMPERNAISYAAMITGIARAGMLDKAEKLYSDMPVKWRDPVCSNALINGLLKVGRLEEAGWVFEGMVERDVVSWSSMVDGYCKEQRIVDARNLFDIMPERNVVTWTAMIDGYMKIESFKEGFELFLGMRREGIVKVNSTTLTVLFEACGTFGRCGEGIQVHGLVSHMGFDFDVFLGNSIMTMYCRFGCMDVATKIFHQMSRKDVVSWNSLIAGYVQCGSIEEAFRLFERMPGKDVVSWTTMITGFSSRGITEKCVQLFKLMPEKDDISWTAVISGFVNNGEYEEAFRWFIEMLQKAVRPNPLTLSSVLSASASLATLNQGLQIHAHVLKMVMEFDLSVQNSLVSMYSKCGNMDDAYRIFTNIIAPNIVSFNSMITGYAQNGFGEEALRLFRKMQNEGRETNQITFLGVLSACTHVGFVEEGWNYFMSMNSQYNIEPGPDHYACMVDLFGRAGLLDKAVDLIQSMPFEPHSGVWGALLGASRTHMRIDIAKLAAEHLIKLEPDNATPYVVLSNLYSVTGKRKDGNEVRMTKKSKGIRKNPGCSWIIVNDKVHLFHAGDEYHMDLERIKVTLWTIAVEMKQLDYNRY
ncbi:pentatricopeptide repeat-containing protein At1g53600, mitochondrial [Corylus avellana]|uniref:pentatricopeptide repeat-containing protein At1g53600, mitochondrial n=1 Tax=Corylus avellana TaxID=13451 RepID=UPI00286A5849|nr:pentatricopeptide repeat-containing protein At1g53600, mitochondrial [Corylus avellana]